MSAETTVLHVSRKTIGGLAAIGLAALAAWALCCIRDPERAYHAYLTAFAFTLSLVMGCLAFVMIAHAANTTWPVAVRRLPEAVAGAMPLLVLLFIPIAIGAKPLYPWARPEEFAPSLRKLLEHRRVWMNESGFAVRGLIYLSIWSAFAWCLRDASLAMERGVDPARCSRRLRRLSNAGLPICAFTSALAAFEWLMSLSVEFSSTMFAAIWIALCLFGGVAATLLLTGMSQSRARLGAIGQSHYSALGRLLLAFLVFLAYTEFFQFLLVWMADRPVEASWFLERGRGVYWSVALFLMIGHFGLTFLALLSYRLKRRLDMLSAIAVWCLFSQYLHIHWLITPASKEPGFAWSDFFALIAFLASTCSVCLWLQRGKPLAPINDPRYLAAFEYQSR